MTGLVMTNARTGPPRAGCWWPLVSTGSGLPDPCDRRGEQEIDDLATLRPRRKFRRGADRGGAVDGRRWPRSRRYAGRATDRRKRWQGFCPVPVPRPLVGLAPALWTAAAQEVLGWTRTLLGFWRPGRGRDPAGRSAGGWPDGGRAADGSAPARCQDGALAALCRKAADRPGPGIAARHPVDRRDLECEMKRCRRSA